MKNKAEECKKLTARLHYRSIYTGLTRFDLVQSNTPVYTVFTHGAVTVPYLLRVQIGVAR